MKHIVPLLFGMSLLISCNSQQDSVQLEIPKNMQAKVGAGQVPSDNPVTMMVINQKNYTWEDVDAYYKGAMQQEKDQPYFKNLKNLAFTMLVNVFHLTEQAPNEVIAYYVEEQAAMPYTPFVAEFVKCLDKLDGYWSEEKIQKFAQDRYEKTKSYYLNNEIWKSKWENEKGQYDALLSVK
ncbi:MAG: hypothetical protein OHK0019_38740 [Saprospiraceae bacterium]